MGKEQRNGYLIVDYTHCVQGDSTEPELIRCANTKELLHEVHERKDRKITVFEIGDCFLDWS